MCESTNFDKDFPKSGKLDFPFTNDGFVKFLMQRNPAALRSLICGVLRIDPSDVREMVLENPILIGKGNTEKEFILDLKVRLNNDTVINIEMQVNNLS